MGVFNKSLTASIFIVIAIALPTNLNVMAKVTSIEPMPEFEQLLKIDDKEYKITHNNSISMQPISQNRIKKIAYGKETFVNIVRSTSGTYSSNSIISRNVLYPGIVVTEVRNQQPKDAVVYLLKNGWVKTPISSANSFVVINQQ